jgi:hypothetical protein
MKTSAAGPWKQGIVNALLPQQVPADALVDATNVDIDRAGVIASRRGYNLTTAGTATDLFTHGGRTFAVLDGSLGEVTPQGSFTPMAAVDSPVAWTVLDGNPVFVTNNQPYMISGSTVGELPEHTITDYASLDDNEFVLAGMPGGQAATYWRGRLVVARGTSLFFSEPFNYRMYDQLRSVLPLGEQLSWIVALDTGLYVGAATSVRFLRGSSPDDLEQVLINDPSWEGSGTLMDAAELDEKTSAGGAQVAVWMTSRGFAVGRQDGSVIYPQAARLAQIPGESGKVVVLGDRITVLPNRS